MTDKELFNLAKESAEHAYAPYSGFKVGAAALTASGDVYLGANVENASYGATVCAERAALTRAIYDGHREFTALAVVSLSEKPAWPCGICRQFLSEFGDSTRVIVGVDAEHLETFTIGELLPEGFRL
jgi:cytidine deaminase